jgi:hypothetical protein
MLQMFCARPRTWLANSCALGQKRMLQKMLVTSDKLHHCQLLKNESTAGGLIIVGHRKAGLLHIWPYKLYIFTNQVAERHECFSRTLCIPEIN